MKKTTLFILTFVSTTVVLSVIAVIALQYLFGITLRLPLTQSSTAKSTTNISPLDYLSPTDSKDILATEQFNRVFLNTDYKSLYSATTDKVVVHLFVPDWLSDFTEIQYAINFYTTREIDGYDVGYLMACIETAAWALWGKYETGIKTSIFSGCNFDQKSSVPEHTVLYGSGYRCSFWQDEYGKKQYHNFFPRQTLYEIYVGAGYNIWKQLNNDETNVHAWEYNQQKQVYSGYIRTHDSLD